MDGYFAVLGQHAPREALGIVQGFAPPCIVAQGVQHRGEALWAQLTQEVTQRGVGDPLRDPEELADRRVHLRRQLLELGQSLAAASQAEQHRFEQGQTALPPPTLLATRVDDPTQQLVGEVFHDQARHPAHRSFRSHRYTPLLAPPVPATPG
jgi:hypothetical protein